jgi:hypothetical protein
LLQVREGPPQGGPSRLYGPIDARLARKRWLKLKNLIAIKVFA